MKISVIGNTYHIKKTELEKVAEAAFSLLHPAEGSIEMTFVIEKRIQELNNSYRKIDKPTDVLSFVIDEKPLIGQVFICYNIAKKQAKLYGKSFEDEVFLLLVHGILHIYGYDHEAPAEANKMELQEHTILNKFRGQLNA